VRLLASGATELSAANVRPGDRLAGLGDAALKVERPLHVAQRGADLTLCGSSTRDLREYAVDFTAIEEHIKCPLCAERSASPPDGRLDDWVWQSPGSHACRCPRNPSGYQAGHAGREDLSGPAGPEPSWPRRISGLAGPVPAVRPACMPDRTDLPHLNLPEHAGGRGRCRSGIHDRVLQLRGPSSTVQTATPEDNETPAAGGGSAARGPSV
jgi:hypothetical protein